MFRKDNFLYGFLAGLLLPGLAWCYENCIAQANGHKSTIFLISMGLNLLLIRLAYKKEFPRTANGIMLITFLSAIALFYFKLYS